MTDLIRTPRTGTAERQDPATDPEAAEAGRWFWVKDGKDDNLACVIRVGSNYAEVETPYGSSWRILLSEWSEKCTLAPDAKNYIQDRIKSHRAEAARLMGEVQEITERLAISMGPRALQTGDTEALAVRSDTQDLDKYKSDLERAKKETLPELFEKIEGQNRAMSKWMTAELIPLKAQVASMRPSLEAIEGRILNVELYAGLCEQTVKVKDGRPASIAEVIHLFQRRCYMDEECLVNYRHGGMTFKNIEEFDKWLGETENLDRVLPYPKCLVAFQVRRKEKDWSGLDIWTYIHMALSGEFEADKWTFLYLRNGEQLWRLSTKIEFDAKLFPDFDKQQLSVGQLYCNDKGELLSEGEYEGMILKETLETKRAEAKYREETSTYPARLAAYEVKNETYTAALGAYEEAKKKWELEYEAWEAKGVEQPDGGKLWRELEPPKPKNPEKPYAPDRPYQSHVWIHSKDWSPLTRDNVYYDDAMAQLKKQMDHHNRLVLILQGVLDRSLALHPHPAWKLWEGRSFEAAIKLVYDSDRAITSGPPPDFEAYRARLNASIGVGSITVGQELQWEMAEANKGNIRKAAFSFLLRDYRDHVRFKPIGNPGPGKLARVDRFSKKKCTFRWTRERTGHLTRRDQWYGNKSYSDKLPCIFTVDSEHLLNVSAYKPGDYRQFFADPRTRADYLKWAPLLLEAEEYWAGNRKLGGAED